MKRGGAGSPGAPIQSRRHPLIVRMRRLVRRPQLMRREQAFLLDGIHLLEEALSAQHAPETILIAPRLSRTEAGRSLLERMTHLNWPLVHVADELLDDLGATQTPQGVIALVRRRASSELPDPPRAARLAALILAGLQDPHNVGALGCRTLVATPGTVDPYHPRALRASSGALLHLTVITDATPDALAAWFARTGQRAIGLVPRSGLRLDRFVAGSTPIALVLGSEGHGIPAEVGCLCAENVTIPMTGELDSLGVAAAGSIALYALTR
jgi:TrmH family RNA methyltransferase